MPSPTSGGAISTFNATQDSGLDGLLMGSRWGDGLSVPVTITYSFPTAESSWSTSVSTGYGAVGGSGEPWNDLKALTDVQQQAVRDIFAMIGSYANIDFVEVDETASSVGDIRIAFSGAVDGAAVAHAYTPDGRLVSSAGGIAYPYAGDVWLNADDYGSFDANPGNYDYYTLIHEIGHALGFKHTFEKEGDFAAVPQALDSYDYSVMSYSPLSGNENLWMSLYPTTFMSLDVAALQYIYGSNEDYRTEDDAYVFTADGSYNEVLWDAGGFDTLYFQSVGVGAVIDLAPGSWQQLGKPVEYYDDLNGEPVVSRAETVFILEGVVIENAFGGTGNDSIAGNAANNILVGEDGDDLLYGKEGNDFLLGGSGNDTLDGGGGTNRLDGDVGSDLYVVRDEGDVIVESLAANSDIDSVHCYLSNYVLPDEIENGVILTVGAANMTGNAGNNTIFSGRGNCVIDGGAGSDTVDYSLAAKAVKVNLGSTGGQKTGGAGTDTLISIENLVGSKYNDKLAGDDGANLILGDGGRDLMTGGGGADIFVFKGVADSNATTLDTITDFVGGIDLIDLSAIDADASTADDDAFTGFVAATTDFTVAGQLKLENDILYGNTDADGDAEFVLKLTGVSSLSLDDLIA